MSLRVGHLNQIKHGVGLCSKKAKIVQNDIKVDVLAQKMHLISAID